MADRERTREQIVNDKTASIIASQTERQNEIESKRTNRLAFQNPEESATSFFEKFKSEVKGITSKLEATRDEAKKGQSRHLTLSSIENLSTDIKSLQQYLSDSVRYLPPYDVQQSQKHIDGLQENLKAAELEMIPKKKFAFKSKKKKSTPAKEAASMETSSESSAHKKTTSDPDQPAYSYSIELCNRENETCSLKDDEINSKDVQICALKNCIVELAGQPNVLHIKELVDCQVFIGPVSRSLLLHNCVGCTFSIACQQLRVHDTTKTDFYLHVTSKAIIEDCHELRFAPYNWTYDGIERDYEISGLNQSVNSWDKVDDFKWLNPTAPSPNWTIIPENERKSAT